MNIEKLRRHVAAFKEAIVQCPKNSLPITFEKFPIGSCSDSVLLLGAFLENQGFGTFLRFTGERGAKHSPPFDWESHAWARKGDVIVDITAEQFRDGPDDFVIQGPSPFHESFKGKPASKADFREYDDRTNAIFKAAYIAVMEGYKSTVLGT